MNLMSLAEAARKMGAIGATYVFEEGISASQIASASFGLIIIISPGCDTGATLNFASNAIRRRR
jgi:hypothetical protein